MVLLRFGVVLDVTLGVIWVVFLKEKNRSKRTHGQDFQKDSVWKGSFFRNPALAK